MKSPMIYVFMIAALVAAIIERRIRRSLQSTGERIQSGPRVYTNKPTFLAVLEWLTQIIASVVIIDSGEPEKCWDDPTAETETIFKHARVNIDTFRQIWAF